MPNRDERLRELQVEEIANPISGNDLLTKSILAYDQQFTFLNGSNAPLNNLSILDAGTVVYLIGLISGAGTPDQVFTEADLVSDGFGGFYLPITLPSTQIPTGVLINISGTITNLVPQYQNGQISGFLSNAPQSIRVKIQ